PQFVLPVLRHGRPLRVTASGAVPNVDNCCPPTDPGSPHVNVSEDGQRDITSQPPSDSPLQEFVPSKECPSFPNSSRIGATVKKREGSFGHMHLVSKAATFRTTEEVGDLKRLICCET